MAINEAISKRISGESQTSFNFWVYDDVFNTIRSGIWHVSKAHSVHFFAERFLLGLSILSYIYLSNSKIVTILKMQ